MKFTLKGYFDPTPKRMRVLGDSLLSAATTGAGFAIANDYKAIGITLMIIGVIGKFLSNFFSD